MEFLSIVFCVCDEIIPTVDGDNVCKCVCRCVHKSQLYVFVCVGCNCSLEHDIISLGGFTEGGDRK